MKIAPKCGERQSPPVPRCSFSQFLNYIWAPNTNIKPIPQWEADRPTSDATVRVPAQNRNGRDIPAQRVDILTQNLNNVIGTISKAQSGNTPSIVYVCDWVDVERLSPGSADYNAAVSDIGNRGQAIRQWLRDNPNDNNAKRVGDLLDRARHAIQGAHEMRIFEQDNHQENRRPNAEDLRNGVDKDSAANRKDWMERKTGVSMVMKDAPNDAGTLTVRGAKIINVRASIKAVGEEKWDTAYRAWLTNSYQGGA